MSGKIKSKGILIRKQPYSESSLLLHVFSDMHGNATYLAKGLRRGKEHRDFLINPLNEYEFITSEATSSGIHIVTDFYLLSEYPTDLAYETWCIAQAGLELLTKIMIPIEEAPVFCNSIRLYLNHLLQINKNPIAIFWRFLLHIYKLLGIEMVLDQCSLCNRKIRFIRGYDAIQGNVLCTECLVNDPVGIGFDPAASELISKLPIIGNYLNDLEIPAEVRSQLNLFFLNYLSRQFHKDIYLKSLSALETGQKTTFYN